MSAAEALREGLRVLREQHRAWRASLAACAPLMVSLAGLAEQAEAARRAPLEASPLGAFGRLRGRLRGKLRGATEALLAELRQERLAELRAVREAVGGAAAGLLPLVAGLEEAPPGPSALCPAPAEVVAALLDAEAFYHAVCLEVRLLLLRIGHEGPGGGRAWSDTWQRILRRGQQGPVEDTLLKVSFFLEGT